MDSNAKVVAALLAGLAAGAALGILFAPEKGTETREKLNDSLRDLGEALKERTAEQMEHLNDFKDKVLAAVKTKVNKGERMVEEGLEEHA
ncbi:YtxH-like protein [Parapedobacter composti]|uniref:YtxH-like protein n=1 Tax=Parapedobacter composti TaxID=623281 RepID=A0A1I1G1X4_9SPHI|nr:YtxH domain-containing protein [Parapedobacter composti]SFC03170.1 YtxH-like protein [Parapedobacter composti]